jgi:hypothetical protein
MPAWRRAIPTISPLAAWLLAGCNRAPDPPREIQTTLPVPPAVPQAVTVAAPLPPVPGRVDKRTFETDFNGDGIADERTVISYRYDANGVEIGQLIEEDFDADGAIDSRRSTATAYQQTTLEH